ncbi:MAG: hypothetical protein GY830_02820 [Bacteroidetes bacterium]|nr:hypothetical protein [Bacteroidota bacterium]
MIFELKHLKKKLFYRLLILILILYCTDKKNEDNTIQTIQNRHIAGNKQKSNITENKNQNSNFNIKSEYNNKLIIVIIHGLIAKQDLKHSKKNFFKLIRKIRNKFYGRNIEIKLIEIGETVDMHIYQQSKVVYIKLKKYFKENNINPKSKIIAIGHSAGGLVSYELYKKYNKRLNIRGIVTISCPWRGTKLASSKRDMKMPLKLLLGKYKKIYNCRKKGIRDVTPNSKFLKWVEETIGTVKIPIWAIGGKSDYYTKIFSTSLIKSICFKEKATERSFFGSRDHDGVVPLNSQLGKDLKNIRPFEIEEPINHSKDLKTSLSKYAMKAVNIFDKIIPEKIKKELIDIQYENAITESNSTIKIVLKFIQKYGFENKKFKKIP